MGPIGTLENHWSAGDPEWHNDMTITLGELVEWGWIDWDDPSWKWDAYDDDQYHRVCKKIEGHYWDRELAILPPGNWKRRYLNLMQEIMPKYKILYDTVKDGINILQDQDRYGTSRDVFLEFPQTALAGDHNYANNANDREYEDITNGSAIDKIGQFAREYRDIDYMIVEELEPLFSCLMTVNINSF